MKEKKPPRLRTVEKVVPPYPLNQFPQNFGFNLGKEIIYLSATKDNLSLEGQEWEKIFAFCIGAQWKPSNVGLDDVVLGSCAWGAKTIKAKVPSKQKTIRLISGRNSPNYSFGETRTDVNPNYLGSMVLEIWNERVSAIRMKYKHLRTVVLMKSQALDELGVFEFDTIRYDTNLYSWEWNKNNNLVGKSKSNDKHCFTWQPHGSQFTILEQVPNDCMIIKIKKPEKLNKDAILKKVGFTKDWIQVLKKND